MPGLRASGIRRLASSTAFRRKRCAADDYQSCIRSCSQRLQQIGNGKRGHVAGILVSKDFGKHHLDFNESLQWLGRSGADGFDHNYFSALAYAHPLTEKLGVTAEIAGFSRANAATPWTLTVLQALTYNFSPRLVLDAGCYVAAHGNLPRVTFFAGVTYAVADLYRYLRGTRH